MNKRTLQILVFLILIINLVTTIFLVAMTDRSLSQVTARASSAQIHFCVNAPPQVVIPCNDTLVQDQPFSCQLNFTDQDTDQNHTFSVHWPLDELFTITPDGFINWTPTNAESGRDYLVLFRVDDNFGCTNSLTTRPWNFTILNVNDAPVFNGPIPDQNITVNTTTFLFSLSTYFRDPDGDPLTYTIAAEQTPFTLATTTGGAFTARTNFCQPETVAVQLTATDPFNLSVTSNLFTITVDCPEPDESTGGGTPASGGGGGGGSGADAGICRSDWECLDWYPCLPTGYQWMHCFDMNGCQDPKFLKRECEYVGPQPTCDENWLCGEWGSCQPEGLQYRTCEDLAVCSTEIFMPSLEQRCEYTGDPERPPFIETPSFIEPDQFNMWLLFIILASSLLVVGALRVYHEELLRGITKVKLFLIKKKEQEIWLTKTQRTYFLQQILKAEEQATSTGKDVYEPLTQVARELLAELSYSPLEMTKEEFLAGIDKRKPSKELRQLLADTFERNYLLEASTFELHLPLFFSFSEELRLLVCMLSEQEVADLERTIVEFELSDEQSYMEEAIIRMVRIYRALQFGQEAFAQEEYQKLVTTYEDMPYEDQQAIYSDTARTFTMVHYTFERLYV